MKKGTKVHKKLEDEVHRRVEVKVASKEEGWGLRVWNVVRGLRMMRNEGKARELEVWGLIKTIDGLEVVRGVVDEVSLGEEEVLVPEVQDKRNEKGQAGKRKRGRRKKAEKEAEEAERDQRRQRKITDFTTSQGLSKIEESVSVDPKLTRKYFISDVKTRGAKTVPSGSSLRPTIYQLMLYHRLLGDLADGKMEFAKLWQRHDVDPEKRFSDAFLERMAMLDDVFEDEESEPDGDIGSSNAINTPPPESSAGFETMQMPDVRRAYRNAPADDSTIDANDSFQTATTSSFTAALNADAQALDLEHEDQLFSSQPVEDDPNPSNLGLRDRSYALSGSLNAADFLPDRAPSPASSQHNPEAGTEPTPPTTQQSTFTSSSTQTPFTPSQSLTSPTALQYTSLSLLTNLLADELNLTFPLGSASLSPILRAEYRDKNSGEVMGENTFEYDGELLDKYLENVMQWWRGERAPKGVVVEEAWKCGSCEFRAGVGGGWRG